VPTQKALISLGFPYCRARHLKALTQPMIFETHDSGSESHISKLAERMRAPLSSMRIQPQQQPVCLFLNAVVNNDCRSVDSHTTCSRQRRTRRNESDDASTLEHANRVTLEYQAGPAAYAEDQASGLSGTIRPVAVSSGAYRIRVSIVIGCSGLRRRLAGL
jgi:hypothetical protein